MPHFIRRAAGTGQNTAPGQLTQNCTHLPEHYRPERTLIGASGSYRRKSFARRPNAILFWRLSGEANSPRLISPSIRRDSLRNSVTLHAYLTNMNVSSTFFRR